MYKESMLGYKPNKYKETMFSFEININREENGKCYYAVKKPPKKT